MLCQAVAVLKKQSLEKAVYRGRRERRYELFTILLQNVEFRLGFVTFVQRMSPSSK